jgi:hypothetical protein
MWHPLQMSEAPLLTFEVIDKINGTMHALKIIEMSKKEDRDAVAAFS